MKKIIMLLFVSLTFAGTSFAQTGGSTEVQSSEVENDTITYLKKGLGYSYTQGGKALNMTEIGSMLKDNEAAYKMYKGAKGVGYVSYPFAFVGGWLSGYELANLLFGKEINMTKVGIAGACVAVSVGIASIAEVKLRKSVQKYNEGLLNPAPSSSSDDVAINFGITPSGGLGFTLSF